MPTLEDEINLIARSFGSGQLFYGIFRVAAGSQGVNGD